MQFHDGDRGHPDSQPVLTVEPLDDALVWRLSHQLGDDVGIEDQQSSKRQGLHDFTTHLGNFLAFAQTVFLEQRGDFRPEPGLGPCRCYSLTQDHPHLFLHAAPMLRRANTQREP